MAQRRPTHASPYYNSGQQYGSHPGSPSSSSGNGGSGGSVPYDSPSPMYQQVQSPLFNTFSALSPHDPKQEPTYNTQIAMANVSQAHRGEAEQLRARIAQLEHERARMSQYLANLQRMQPHQPSPELHRDWVRRTDVRRQLLCSPNRAGNALCQWHDSRRERRVHAPRNAPEGYLNCGCQCEEALFEEALARNGVGSYLPAADMVRMDPALRRPLLALLKRRYNYQDGDFEIDPTTGQWANPGESSAHWEQKLRTHTRKSALA